MRKLSYILLLLSVLSTAFAPNAGAQNKAKEKDTPITVFGNVKNAQGLNMEAVDITVQESFINTLSDQDGNFEITVPKKGSIIVFREPFYKELMLTVTDESYLNIVLEEAEEGEGVDDLVQMPWYVANKRAITAAVGSVGSQDLAITPVPSLTNALSGKLPGVGIRTLAGYPGADNGYLRVRGVRTLEDGGLNTMDKGSVYTPLIIVDGFQRSFSQLFAEEIESITVIKDAAATALYGLRGAKGVIMVTTKRGQTNRRTINVEMSSGFVTPTNLPDFVNSYDYANLYNEARVNDGKDPLYSQEDLQKYQDHSSPLTHPDVDYYDEFIKKAAFQARTSISMSGGNKAVRYFVMLGYINQQGLFKHTNENSDFSTKTRYTRYNLRSNLDVNLSSWLTLNATIGGRIQDRRYPYSTDETILSTLATYAPNAFPIKFQGVDPELKKEVTMLGGNSVYADNPLGLLSYRGYNENTQRYYQVSGKLNADLGRFITPGLKADLTYNLDGYNLYRVEKVMSYKTWGIQQQPDGSFSYVGYGTESSLTADGSYDVDRMNGLDARLSYDRAFGKHEVSAFASYYHQKTEPRQTNYSDEKWQGFQFRASYNYDGRYYIDLVGSYSGSDRFYFTNNKKEFYPAVSGAWIVSSEKFMKATENWLDFLKIRASWGISGNDVYTFTDINGNAERYPARDRWWTYSSQQYFGTALTSVVFVKEGRAANPDISTEKGRMVNIGLDAAMFNHKFTLGLDLWQEKRYNIFTVAEGALPNVLGMTSTRLPITNDGQVDSKGFEFSMGWNHTIGDFKYNVNGYVDASWAEIISMGEPQRDYQNLVQTGHAPKSNFALVALGLFKDWDDVYNSPTQTFGNYQPGDIKYKDVNEDGIIDSNDLTCMGNQSTPRLNFALNLSLAYKNIDLTAVFSGQGMRNVYLGNQANWAFYNNGKALRDAMGRYMTYEDGTNNWATATYPRLSSQDSDNNFRSSTYWLKDGTFVRLKNLELGYSIPKRAVQKLNIYGLRLYVNAYNVFTISNIKNFDPEDVDAGITEYPMTRVFNFGVSLKF